VKEIHPGDIFGEISLLNHVRRFGSVRSKDHCTIGAMNSDSFHQMLKNYPEINNRLKQMAIDYDDHWKREKIKALKNIDYFGDLPMTALEDL
jgi:Cyclic nucleotide-binding domain